MDTQNTLNKTSLRLHNNIEGKPKISNWSLQDHWNFCGQSCPCCRSYNPEDVFGTCFICNEIIEEEKALDRING